MRALFIASACCAVFLPSFVAADEFSEFRIPRHRWHTLSTSFSGRANPSKGHAGGRSGNSGNLGATLLLGGEWGLDSDEFAAWVTANLQSSVNSDHVELSEEQTLPPDFRFRSSSETTRRLGREEWDLAVGVRHYPWSAPVGFELQGRGTGNYSQFHTRDRRTSSTELGPSRTRNEDRSFNLGWDYNYQALGFASVGYGRVRDATGVYSAYVLEQRLLETGALSRPLSRRARERLAALYTIGPRYSTVHDRSSKFFWRDVEDVLIEDGALGDSGLDAYSLRRADETYAPGSVLRRTGYFLGATSSAEHYQFIQRRADEVSATVYQADTLAYSYSSSGASRLESFDDLLMVGGRAELHRPAGYRWQLDLDGQALFPARDLEGGMRVSSNTTLTYLIADRWLAQAFASQSRSRFHGNLGFLTSGSRWEVLYGVGVRYYLEDRTTLTFLAQERQSVFDVAPVGSTPVHSYSREAAIELALTYRFLGRLDAPGLIEPLRLMSPGY